MVILCAAIITLVGLERLFELHLSNRHAAWSFAQGGIEFGQGHLWPMKLLHTALLGGCLFETVVTGCTTAWQVTAAWGLLALASQILRYSCIITLGHRWNIRVIVVPNLPPVTAGPYRYLRHPNYVAVVAEGVALPLMFGAWRTAVLFTVLNAVLLAVRIRCENTALLEVCGLHKSDGHQRAVPRHG